MSDHSYDVERVTKLMRGLVENMYAECEKSDFEDMRIEQIGIVGIVAFTDPDGEDAEDVFTAFETTRHHVKLGILTTVITKLQRKYS